MSAAEDPQASGTGGGLYYGWYVVAALFFVLTITSGLAFYNLSVYMRALTTDAGFPVTAVSSAIAVFFLASGFGGLGAGRLLQRRDPRFTIVAGGVVGTVSLLMLGRVTTPLELHLVYAVFGLGHACCTLVSATTLVTRWFTEKRSIALSVASTGLSLGGILLTPASAAIIERVGLAAATPWFAAAWFLGVIPVTLLVIRDRPALPAAGDAPAPLDGWRREEALPSRWFVVITASWVLVMLAQVGTLSHLFNLAALRVDAATAATAVSVMATASICGRFLGGWLITRIDTRMFALACIAGQALALVGLAFAVTQGSVLLASVAFGATVGNLLMLQPLLLAEVFGARDYPRIYSVSQLLSTLGVAAGPAIVGGLYDLLGGYGAALLVPAVASAVAFAMMLWVGRLPDGRPPSTVGAAQREEDGS